MAGALFSLAGKRAVVTGASKGIGAAIAQLFAAAGADVAVLGRDHEGLAATKTLVEAEGRRCWVVAADFSTAEGVSAAADELLGHAEAWDCLVNNHGANAQTPLADSEARPGEGGFAFDGEAFSAVIDTNLRSVVQLTSRMVRTGPPPDPEPRHRSSWAEASELCPPCLLCSAQAPAMMAGGKGVVVNISSMQAFFGLENQVAYGASKAALNQATRVMAVELGQSATP